MLRGNDVRAHRGRDRHAGHADADRAAAPGPGHDVAGPGRATRSGGEREQVPPTRCGTGACIRPRAAAGLSPIALQAMTIGTGIARCSSAPVVPGGRAPVGDSDDRQGTGPEAGDDCEAAVHGGDARPPGAGGAGRGWKYQQIQIAPNESQFLETNNYTAAECCRIFGPGFAEIFGYETGGSLTYSNIEQRSSTCSPTQSIRGWCASSGPFPDLLPRPQTVKFNRGALVRTDLLTRYKAHAVALRTSSRPSTKSATTRTKVPCRGAQAHRAGALAGASSPLGGKS
jgi:hypothetical protein